MTELSEKIKEAIKNDLPNQVSIELREHLRECEDIKRENELYAEKNHKLFASNEEYNQKTIELEQELASWVNRSFDLEKRESACLAKENLWHQRDSQLRVDLAEEKTKCILNLVDKVFSLPQVTVSRQFNKDISGHNDAVCEPTQYSSSNSVSLYESKIHNENETTTTIQGKQENER